MARTRFLLVAESKIKSVTALHHSTASDSSTPKPRPLQHCRFRVSLPEKRTVARATLIFRCRSMDRPASNAVPAGDQKITLWFTPSTGQSPRLVTRRSLEAPLRLRQLRLVGPIRALDQIP